MAVDPITIIATIDFTIKLIDKLSDKFPDYKERIKKDYNETKLKYIEYKKMPRHKRISRYMFNLKTELENHLFIAEEFIK